jgi:hypothetical protein
MVLGESDSIMGNEHALEIGTEMNRKYNQALKGV